MNLITLFATFTGRIGRKSWWIGFLLLTVVEFGLIALLDPAFLSEDPVTPNLAHTLVTLVLCVPALAITLKRFNDRDYVWWIGYAVFVPAILFYIASYFGLFLNPDEFSLTEHLLFWPMVLLGLLVLVDNGFMRGTKGPNRYGPDPNTDAEFETA